MTNLGDFLTTYVRSLTQGAPGQNLWVLAMVPIALLLLSVAVTTQRLDPEAKRLVSGIMAREDGE